MGIQDFEAECLDLSIGEIQLENGYGVRGRRDIDTNG
jgi:hypothetical protein